MIDDEKELADEQNEEAFGAVDTDAKEPIDEGSAEKPVKEKDFKKLSAREAVRDAFEKQKAKEDVEPKAKDKKVESKPEEDTSEVKKVEKASDNNLKEKAPPGWTKGGKAKWDALDAEVKESILKREKEVSDGFAEYGKKTKELEELNNVFAPREAELNKLGVSKAQITQTLFQWFDALSGADKVNSWLQLGKNYGISDETLKQHYLKGNQTPQTNQAPTTQTQPSSELLEVKTELNQIKQTFANQQQAESDAFLNNWATDKPHYQAVRRTMLAIFQSGQLKLTGTKDLDEAYNRACYADPTIRAELKSAEDAASEKTAKEVAEKKEADRQERLKKARSASTSIKSGSPASPGSTKAAAKPKNISAGESIRMALQELRAD